MPHVIAIVQPARTVAVSAKHTIPLVDAVVAHATSVAATEPTRGHLELVWVCEECGMPAAVWRVVAAPPER